MESLMKPESRNPNDDAGLLPENRSPCSRSFHVKAPRVFVTNSHSAELSFSELRLFVVAHTTLRIARLK